MLNLIAHREFGQPYSLDSHVEEVNRFTNQICTYLSNNKLLSTLGKNDFIPLFAEESSVAEIVEEYLRSNYDLESKEEFPTIGNSGNESLFSKTGLRTPLYLYDKEKALRVDDDLLGLSDFYLVTGGLSWRNLNFQLVCPRIKVLDSMSQIPDLKKMLLHFINDNGLTSGRLRSIEFDQACEAQLIETGKYGQIGQLRESYFVGIHNYIDYPKLPELLPCDIDFEVTSNGGTLVSLFNEVPDANNMAHVKKATRFFDVLHSLHLVQHKFAISGWPPDELEDKYARQIVGANVDRKYSVAFCNFDGYDSSRNVLLYAKLFRKTADELSPHPAQLATSAYIAEARRQITAVDKAGGDSIIEWHIGIEAHAEKLKSMFSQVEDISIDRLKVVYTECKED